jgi:hypothetical protein
VLRIDPVMNAVEPGLEVGKHEMNQGQILFGDLRLVALRDGEVVVASLGEAGVAPPCVRDDHRALLYGVVHEAAKSLRRTRLERDVDSAVRSL